MIKFSRINSIQHLYFQKKINQLLEDLENNQFFIKSPCTWQNHYIQGQDIETYLSFPQIVQILVYVHQYRLPELQGINGHKPSQKIQSQFIQLGLAQSLQTNAQWMGNFNLEADQILRFIQNPPKLEDNYWQIWAGEMLGEWHTLPYRHYFDEGEEIWADIYTDRAKWHQPQNKIQQVDFYQDKEQMVYTGFNQIISNQNYVIGFDPKGESKEINWNSSPHIGFPFQIQSLNCLIWLTPQEAFLECIGHVRINGQLQQRRSSASINGGIGQWIVKP